MLNCACVRLRLTRGLNARRRSAAADISACVRYADAQRFLHFWLRAQRQPLRTITANMPLSRVTCHAALHLKNKMFTPLSVVRIFLPSFFLKSVDQATPPRVARHFAVRRTDCHVSRVTPLCILKTKCFLLRNTPPPVVRAACRFRTGDR